MEQLVRVTNTRPTILHLPDQLSVSEGGGGPRIAGLGTGRSLIPGGNNVPAAEWKRAKSNRTVAQWLKIGWLTEGGDVAAPTGASALAPLTLSGYGDTSAVALVEGEDDLSVLERWAKDETRPAVRKALEAAIKRRSK